eukprot:38781-Eustigmatos_ZCMA.PRE.1
MASALAALPALSMNSRVEIKAGASRMACSGQGRCDAHPVLRISTTLLAATATRRPEDSKAAHAGAVGASRLRANSEVKVSDH